jgi:hypothetical protein
MSATDKLLLSKLWTAFINDPLWPWIALLLIAGLFAWGQASSRRQRRRDIAAGVRAALSAQAEKQ